MKAVVLAAALAASALCTPAGAAVFVFTASLDGPSEAPPNASPGTGFGRVTFDDVAHTMRLQATFSGLVGPTTVAHIHGPTALAGAGLAAVATSTPSFLGFPGGVTSGTYDATFDMTLASSYRAGFITASGGTTAGAEMVLLSALKDGKAYLNIHSTTFPGGEIRGFFAAVPEPGTWAMMIVGFGLTGAVMRQRRRTLAV